MCEMIRSLLQSLNLNLVERNFITSETENVYTFENRLNSLWPFQTNKKIERVNRIKIVQQVTF